MTVHEGSFPSNIKKQLLYMSFNVFTPVKFFFIQRWKEYSSPTSSYLSTPIFYLSLPPSSCCIIIIIIIIP